MIGFWKKGATLSSHMNTPSYAYNMGGGCYGASSNTSFNRHTVRHRWQIRDVFLIKFDDLFLKIVDLHPGGAIRTIDLVRCAILSTERIGWGRLEGKSGLRCRYNQLQQKPDRPGRGLEQCHRTTQVRCVDTLLDSSTDTRSVSIELLIHVCISTGVLRTNPRQIQNHLA